MSLHMVQARRALGRSWWASMVRAGTGEARDRGTQQRHRDPGGMATSPRANFWVTSNMFRGHCRSGTGLWISAASQKAQSARRSTGRARSPGISWALYRGSNAAGRAGGGHLLRTDGFPFFNRMRTDWLRGSMALALPAYQHTREVIT